MNTARAAAGRIIYVLPTATGPAGGVKTMFEHANALAAAGFNAALYSRNKDDLPTGFGTAPVLTGPIDVLNNDILVRSEVATRETFQRAATAGCRQFLFVQNHFYVFHSLGGPDEQETLGIDRVFCSSGVIQRFLQTHYKIDQAPIIPYVVTPPSGPACKKAKQIAFMPRKRPFEVDFIRHLFAVEFPDLSHWQWCEIDRMNHDEVLAHLNSAEVFLSLQKFEGFGLPAIEAMAARCLVVGFTGFGGLEYADDSNGVWVEEDNIEAAAMALGTAIRAMEAGGEEMQRKITAGEQRAADYSAGRRDIALTAFYDDALGLA